MSIRVMAEVWDKGPVDPVDCSVLLALANFCNDQGKNCFPSVESIAVSARRSDRTVERSLQVLEEDGWIKIERGSGRGNVSHYEINISHLKERQAVTISDIKESHKGRQPRQERATATTGKGDSHDNPPHPLLGRTVIEPLLTFSSQASEGEEELNFFDGDINKETLPPSPKKEKFVSRASEFKQAFWEYFQAKNQVPPPWDASEGTRLKNWLTANPTITIEQWRAILDNRSKSPVTHAKRLRVWLDSALAWLNGPADDFGKTVYIPQPKPKYVITDDWGAAYEEGKKRDAGLL